MLFLGVTILLASTYVTLYSQDQRELTEIQVKGPEAPKEPIKDESVEKPVEKVTDKPQGNISAFRFLKESCILFS